MLRQYFIDLATDKENDAVASLAKGVLFVLSLFYAVAVVTTRYLYKEGILDRKKFACKVISVGNITWGGTGKTPLVIYLAKKLSTVNCQLSTNKVAVLLRGYGNDERHLLKEKLTDAVVIVGRDRIKGAAEAMKLQRDIVILDDGFQHWRLARDVDILMVDALCPFGNGMLIPRGILREPLSSLKNSDIVILTNAFAAATPLLKVRLNKLSPKVQIFESTYKAVSLKNVDEGGVDFGEISARRCAALCAIGNRGSFYNTLKEIGARIELELPYPDHYDYKISDVEEIADKCSSLGISTIVTTQKDMVKLRSYSLQLSAYSLQLMALEVEPEIKDEDRFLARLYSLLNS